MKTVIYELMNFVAAGSVVVTVFVICMAIG